MFLVLIIARIHKNPLDKKEFFDVFVIYLIQMNNFIQQNFQHYGLHQEQLYYLLNLSGMIFLFSYQKYNCMGQESYLPNLTHI